MDGARFDALARSLTTVRSRRSIARLLGALTLSGVLASRGSGEASAALLLGGARCSRKTQCKSGRCLKPVKATCDCTKTGCTCRCACSQTAPNVGCTNPDSCKKVTCTATGRCVAKPKCAADANPCTQDLCDNGVCSHPRVDNGTSCGGQLICQDGVCACPPGFADCDGDGNCDVNLKTDPAHCGRCSKVCPSGGCVNGACTSDSPGCPAGCDGNGYTRVGGGSIGICALIGDCAGQPGCDEDSDCPIGSACLVGCGGTCSVPCR